MRHAILTDQDLTGVVDLRHLIDAVRDVHIDLARGDAAQPVPAISDTSKDTVILPMVATSHRLGLSVVKVLTDARGAGDGPAQQSTVVVLDARTGTRLAVMTGATCTRMRTAAASAVATDALARPDSRILGLVGAGPLAVEHVAALRTVRAFDTVVVWSRSAGRLDAFRDALRQREQVDGLSEIRVVAAPDPRRVVETCDVLCTVTPAHTPVIEGAWFGPGLHVNAVGAPPRPDHREIDSEGMARATVVVDSTDIQLRKSGEVLLSLADGTTTEDHYRTELGAVLAGLAPGRTGPDQITMFNSVGIALQDLAFAALALGLDPQTPPTPPITAPPTTSPPARRRRDADRSRPSARPGLHHGHELGRAPPPRKTVVSRPVLGCLAAVAAPYSPAVLADPRARRDFQFFVCCQHHPRRMVRATRHHCALGTSVVNGIGNVSGAVMPLLAVALFASSGVVGIFIMLAVMYVELGTSAILAPETYGRSLEEVNVEDLRHASRFVDHLSSRPPTREGSAEFLPSRRIRVGRLWWLDSDAVEIHIGGEWMSRSDRDTGRESHDPGPLDRANICPAGGHVRARRNSWAGPTLETAGPSPSDNASARPHPR